MKEKIILVDKKDKEIGIGDKLKIHQKGKRHRSFSIFVFNQKGELLLQKRTLNKYHSGGLWSNTCCGHPRPEETVLKAAHRRLKEEMGFDCPLKEIFFFTYRVKFKNNLMENEFDHVLIGQFNGRPKPDAKEVMNCQWLKLGELKKEIRHNPEKFTYWFKRALDQIISFSPLYSPP